MQVRPTFLSPPSPPRFPNVGVSPVSARAGIERGRCLLPSVHDWYNPLLWWSDVETQLLLVVLHGQLSASCRGDALRGCSRVCGRKNRAVLNTEPSVDSSAVPVLDHDLLHGREVRSVVRKAELQSRIGAVSVGDGWPRRTWTQPAPPSRALRTRWVSRCLGFAMEQPISSPSGRLNASILLVSFMFVICPMCETIRYTKSCTAHTQRPKTTQSKRDLTNFHTGPLW